MAPPSLRGQSNSAKCEPGLYAACDGEYKLLLIFFKLYLTDEVVKLILKNPKDLIMLASLE